MLQNYYSILGISPGASLDEIKKAFRIKAKLFHPDVSKSPRANELFILLNEAYEVLADEHKRFVYDLKLKYKQAPVNPPQDPRKYGTASQYGNFQQDWQAAQKRRPQAARENPVATPFIVSMMYVFGMFIGFTIVLVTLQSIYLHYWPSLFILLTLPGFLLIKEGWEGVNGKGSWIKMMIKKMKAYF